MVAAQCGSSMAPGAESGTSSFFSNVHLHSDWQPGVRLAYLKSTNAASVVWAASQGGSHAVKAKGQVEQDQIDVHISLGTKQVRGITSYTLSLQFS